MRIVSLICLMVVAPLAVSRAATPLDTQYRFQVENGIVTLFHLKSGEVLQRTSLAEFNVAPTRDKLRHLALNLTAAVVAGNGAREHSVDPSTPVCTSVEKEKASAGACVTATVEHGIGFFILSDKESAGRYEAIVECGVAKIGPTPSGKQRPNQTLERTADRRKNLLSMTSTLKSEAQLGVISVRSACSR